MSLDGTNFEGRRDALLELFKVCHSGDLSSFEAHLTHAATEMGCPKSSVVADCRDANGRSTLHFAAFGGNEAVARRILEINPTCRSCLDASGENPLFSAVRIPSPNVAKLLIYPHRLEISKSGLTPLHAAAQVGTLECIQVLLEAGADATMSTSQFGSPLFCAVGSKQLEVVMYLSKLCPELVDKPCGSLPPPVLLAASLGWLEGLRALLSARPEAMAATDVEGWTVVHCAVEAGSVECLGHLWEFDDARFEEQCRTVVKGETPIALAMKHGKFGVAKFLESSYSGGLLRTAASNDMTSTIAPDESPEPREDLLLTDDTRKHVDVLKAEGNSKFSLGEHREALRCYTLALESCPTVPDTAVTRAALHSNCSLMFLRLGLVDEAVGSASRAVEADPTWPRGHQRLAAAWREKGDMAEVATCLYEASRLRPNDKALQIEFEVAVKEAQKQHKDGVGGV